MLLHNPVHAGAGNFAVGSRAFENLPLASGKGPVTSKCQGQGCFW